MAPATRAPLESVTVPWIPPVEIVVWENAEITRPRRATRAAPCTRILRIWRPTTGNVIARMRLIRERVRFSVANMSSPRIVGRRLRSILLSPRTLHAQKNDCRTFVRAAVMVSGSDSDRCREKAMDHAYRNAFYHSVAHRWIECLVLERRAPLPKLPTECYFAPELFRETRNKPQRE